MDLLCINLHFVVLVDMYDKPMDESGRKHHFNVFPSLENDVPVDMVVQDDIEEIPCMLN